MSLLQKREAHFLAQIFKILRFNSVNLKNIYIEQHSGQQFCLKHIYSDNKIIRK